ncbi:hypothetical protein KY314_03260 [Candidatus Woesearchaeota archaeon]|nr:hypothetical protein [Candidatus Woesearchaeota archaeon]
MVKKTHKLDSGDLVEIKEFYDGTYGSVKALAKRFNVSVGTIKWHTNHNNYRKEQDERNRRWRKKNPEAWKKIVTRASKKWNKKNKDKIREIIKRYYENHKKRIREYQKKYYQENKEKILKQKREKYRKKNKNK